MGRARRLLKETERMPDSARSFFQQPVKDVFRADLPAAILERDRRCFRHASSMNLFFLERKGGAIFT